MIELEHGDPRPAVTEGPTVETGTEDHVLAAPIAYGVRKDIFRVSTPDNDENADWPDLGEKGPPEEPAEWGYA
jgi:hypothetical protein